MKHVLLTGATGLIGRYLLRDALAADRRVACVVRGESREEAERRVERIVVEWERRLERRLPRPRCLPGDLCRPGLGLSREDRDWVKRQCGSVLNGSGNVTFHATAEGGEPWRTNVEGVRNLIEVCRDAGIDAFHQLSTAYVCGDRGGVIRESEGDLGQGFDTDYEKSKLAAEGLLRSAGFRRLDFFRPVSVTGDARTGYTTTYHGIYLLVRFTYLAQRRAAAAAGERWHHPVRIFQTGREPHHFIPVDAVSKAVWELVDRPDASGRTYHLSPIEPCTASVVEAALAEFFGYHGVEFVSPDSFSDASLNETERLFYELMSNVRHRYLAGDPTFDCSNTQAALPWWSDVKVDREYLLRLMRFAVADEFGGRRRPV